MTETTPAWLELGYGDIVGAAVSGGDIEVEFANGDVVVLPSSRFGIPANDCRVEFDPDEGLSIQVITSDGTTTDISWSQIRAAADPGFAQELRRRETEEARRLGRRLRALREDKGLSQRDVASLAGMSAPQLSKIESGSFDLRVSTVRTLLRAMGAAFADISGPDAPEVSQRVLRRNAEEAGVPRELITRLIKLFPRDAVPNVIGRAFGWKPEVLLAGVPRPQLLPIQVAFKATRTKNPKESPLVGLAYAVSELALRIAEIPAFQGFPADPTVIRSRAADERGQLTLTSLLLWTWQAGVPVIPLAGSGGFSAAAWSIDGSPVIVLKEAREFEAYWMFDLAHEIGHIASQHTSGQGVVDIDSPTALNESADLQEREADDFALSLLIPNHHQLLDDVRREARGNYLRFKGAVASVASRAEISAGLLGMVAAYELKEIGEYKDRWGSASNLARSENHGRDVAESIARRYLVIESLDAVDALLVRELVLGGA
jgi:transcriptional regulator with XRE-family HTH domain/Zn-dependent peptidase ImmA (M78 family)